MSCSSDGDPQQPPEVEAAGAAGESPSGGSGGDSQPGGGRPTGTSGSAGRAGAASAGSSNHGGNPGSAGTNASGGESEPASAGAANGQAGERNQPSGPVSACGAGSYDAEELGCTACPTLGSTQNPASIACVAVTSTERDGDGNLLLQLHGLAVHESFGGELSVEWQENSAPGSATVGWEYSSALSRYVFHLPVEARYADEIMLSGWAFTDACGFEFVASNLRVFVSGDTWQCG